MKYKYYLAYGSNLNIEQMRHRCPGASVVGTAYIDGYELLFKGSRTGSYLTIEPNLDSCVPVAVWRVTKADEAALDRYEGYPLFYYRKEFTVSTGGRTVNAFAYIMHEDRPIGIPSSFYVNTCAEGYRTFGFDLRYLAEALDRSIEYYDKKVS